MDCFINLVTFILGVLIYVSVIVIAIRLLSKLLKWMGCHELMKKLLVKLFHE